MKALILLVLCIVVVSCVEIRELTTKDLIDISKDTETTYFVKFYGKNCGFCKGMKDEWIKFAEEVEREEYDITIVNYDVHQEDAHIYSKEVTHLLPGPLPGLHLFKGGRFYEFTNPRAVVDKEKYLEFALIGYEEEGVSSASLDPSKRDPLIQGVVQLTEKNFDELTAEGEWVIMVYGSKCGHCKYFAPVFKTFAEEIKERRININVGEFEGFQDMNIVERFNARPWPSIIYLKDGRYYRIDSELLRDETETTRIHKFITSDYKKVSDEFSGVNAGLEKYHKLKAAKNAAKKKKKEEL